MNRVSEQTAQNLVHLVEKLTLLDHFSSERKLPVYFISEHNCRKILNLYRIVCDLTVPQTGNHVIIVANFLVLFVGIARSIAICAVAILRWFFFTITTSDSTWSTTTITCR